MRDGEGWGLSAPTSYAKLLRRSNRGFYAVEKYWGLSYDRTY